MAIRTSTSNRRIRATSLDPDTFREFGQVVQNPATHDQKPALDKIEANQGSATKWLDVTALRNHYELARSQVPASSVMNMFVCKPRQLEDGGFPVRILERHPFTPQTFVPLGLAKDEKTYYLVIVAPTLPVASIMTSEEKNRRDPPHPVPPRQHTSTFMNDFAPDAAPVTATSAQQPKGAGLPDLDNIKAFIARGDQAITYGPGTWHAPMVVLGDRAVDFVVVQYANGVAVEDCQEIVIEAERGGSGIVVDFTSRARL